MHVQQVVAVLEFLRQAGLTANSGMCAFGQREVLEYIYSGRVGASAAVAHDKKRGEVVFGAGMPPDRPDQERYLRFNPVVRAMSSQESLCSQSELLISSAKISRPY